jgi:ubiquinone/menaquinone biosynthesis C-methylase UbiE
MSLSPTFLDLLRAPGAQAPLVLSGATLVAENGGGPRRFRLDGDIPVLLSREERAEAESSIEVAFRERSGTYFADNYASGDSERRARYERVGALLSESGAAGRRVLDVGCGPAILAEPVQRAGGDYYGVDLSLDNLRAGRARAGELQLAVGDVLELPFRSDAFDVSVAMGSLEYVQDLPGALREMVRVTRPGGTLIATFASRSSPRRLLEEGLVHRVRDVRERAAGRGAGVYRRWLWSSRRVTELLGGLGAGVERVEHLGRGLFGYPLSRGAALQRLDERASRRFPAIRSEFLVVARLPEPPPR